jgi:chemotaxis protein MotB
MPKRKRREAESESIGEPAPHWMVTFSDMTTLLLTFFVLLFTFAQFDLVKFRMVLGSIQQALGVQRVSKKGAFQTYESTPFQMFDYQKLDSLIETFYRQTQLYRELKKELEKIPGVQILVSERGVIVRAEEKIFFDLGKADLKPESYPFLEKMTELIKKFENYKVAVEGHTDDLPIYYRFPSNWELSTARASRVVRYFIEKGIPPQRFKAVGYADTKPVVPNTSMENRAQNRRVEFVFSVETHEESYNKEFLRMLEKLEKSKGEEKFSHSKS